MRSTSIARLLSGTALATWFAASVLAQHPFRRDTWFERVDRLGLFVPDWRFFAPNPGIHDYHFLYRDRLDDGATTDWTEIGHVEDRAVRHLVWHPHRRVEKTFFDLAAEILKFIAEAGRSGTALMVSVPYTTVLNYVDRQCRHHERATGIQFLIAASGGYDEEEEPTMIFLSETHPLAA